MVMPELVLIVKRKVVIRSKNSHISCQTEWWSGGVLELWSHVLLGLSEIYLAIR